jgi:hypothetical protein
MISLDNSASLPKTNGALANSFAGSISGGVDDFIYHLVAGDHVPLDGYLLLQLFSEESGEGDCGGLVADLSAKISVV